MCNVSMDLDYGFGGVELRRRKKKRRQNLIFDLENMLGRGSLDAYFHSGKMKSVLFFFSPKSLISWLLIKLVTKKPWINCK